MILAGSNHLPQRTAEDDTTLAGSVDHGPVIPMPHEPPAASVGSWDRVQACYTGPLCGSSKKEPTVGLQYTGRLSGNVPTTVIASSSLAAGQIVAALETDPGTSIAYELIVNGVTSGVPSFDYSMSIIDLGSLQ